jgi:hypothetical protein
MGYLADYEHDLFVSYAHGDKQTPWAKALCDELTKCLNDFLELKGERSVGVWMDDLLQGSYSLQQLKERIDKSAVLLTIMSNPYLKSPWCQSEAGWFADVCRTRTESDGRVFIVRYRETDEKEWPNFLKDSGGHALPGFRFYSHDRNATADPFPFGYPLPKDAEDDSRRNFFAALLSLTEEMGKRLKRLADLPPAPPVLRPAAAATPPIGGGRILRPEPAAPAAQDGKTSVYLAVATEDVAPEHDAVRAKLGEAGFNVLPPPDQDSPAAAQSILSTPPPGCALAAMVLGALPGRSTPIEGEDLVIWQHEQITRHGLKLIAWQPPPLQAAQIRDPKYRAFIEKIQPNQAADADKIAAEVKALSHGTDGARRLVFLDAPDSTGPSPDASQIDSKLRGILGDLKVRVFPLNRSRLANSDLSVRERYRRDLRDLKASCDGIMLLVQTDDLLPDYWLLELERDVIPKASRSLRCAVVDATSDGGLGPIDGVKVFRYANPALRSELQQWLA